MNLLNFKSFAFIAISIFAVNCNKVFLNQLKVGDVINDINLDQSTGEFLGNLFTEETREKYVENRTIVFTRTSIVTYFLYCNDTETLGYFPDIDVGGAKKVDFDKSKLTGSVLGIEDRYIGDYSCVAKKLCVVKNEESLMIGLYDAKDFPDDVKPWIKKSGIFGARKENETSFVASVLTGDCVYQILVYEKFDMSNLHPVKFDYDERTPIHIGRVSTASHNETLENWINDFLKNSGLNLVNMDEKSKGKIFKQFNDSVMIELELRLLPMISY